jgi:hypothetical protein
MDTQNNNNFKVAETFDELMTPEPEISKLNQLNIEPQNISKNTNINKEINGGTSINSSRSRGRGRGRGKGRGRDKGRGYKIKPVVEPFKNKKNPKSDNLFEIAKKTIIGTLLFFVLSHEKTVEMIGKINKNKIVVLVVRLIVFFVLSFVINKYF